MSDDPTPTDGGTPADMADVLAAKDAEIEKWKGLSRKHEERSKANADAAKELETAKTAAMSDQEKAVAEAVAKARTETLAEVGATLVDAEVKAAAAGRTVDVEALLEGLDRKRYLTDEGKPDTDAITKWVNRIAPEAPADEGQKPGAGPRLPVDIGQGQRGSTMPLNGDPILAAVKSELGIT